MKRYAGVIEVQENKHDHTIGHKTARKDTMAKVEVARWMTTASEGRREAGGKELG